MNLCETVYKWFILNVLLITERGMIQIVAVHMHDLFPTLIIGYLINYQCIFIFYEMIRMANTFEINGYSLYVSQNMCTVIVKYHSHLTAY